MTCATNARLEAGTKDAATVFDAVVCEADRVCRQCFTLLRTYRPFPWRLGDAHADVLSFVEYDLPPDAKHDLLDRKYVERVPLAERTSSLYHSEGRSRYCTNCGTTATDTPPPTRDIETAASHAANLSRTYDELGIDHDPETLVETVRQLKRDPDLTTREDYCFRAATAAAIRADGDDDSPASTGA